MQANLRELAESYRPRLIAFAQRLIQTPSLSGQEGAVAELVAQEMHVLVYDRVWTDALGNVIGLVRGQGGGSALFNAHMDHVAPGDESLWPYPPYEGHIGEGHLWGRAASDVKGTLAAQVYALGALHQAGLVPSGDCYMSAVVMEEIGGAGTRRLLGSLKPDVAVVGEATENQLALGHRGRMALLARLRGRSAHASAPARGVNPHYVLARFVLGLEKLSLPSQGHFGASTVVPTLVGSDQASNNVIPGEITLLIDYRNVPRESVAEVEARLQGLLAECLIPGSEGSVELNRRQVRAYTGAEERFPELFPSFELAADHELTVTAQRTLEKAFERPVTTRIWHFATDGGHLMAAGVPTIGFAPGHEQYCHTVQDRIGLDEMVEGMIGYMALALNLGRISQS
jgi:succinyl-diaminopimelate desuccinylase